jgi:hypothetical protein
MCSLEKKSFFEKTFWPKMLVHLSRYLEKKLPSFVTFTFFFLQALVSSNAFICCLQDWICDLYPIHLIRGSKLKLDLEVDLSIVPN